MEEALENGEAYSGQNVVPSIDNENVSDFSISTKDSIETPGFRGFFYLHFTH